MIDTYTAPNMECHDYEWSLPSGHWTYGITDFPLNIYDERWIKEKQLKKWLWKNDSELMELLDKEGHTIEDLDISIWHEDEYPDLDTPYYYPTNAERKERKELEELDKRLDKMTPEEILKELENSL